MGSGAVEKETSDDDVVGISLGRLGPVEATRCSGSLSSVSTTLAGSSLLDESAYDGFDTSLSVPEQPE